MKQILIFAILITINCSSLAQTTIELSEMSESDKNKTGLYKLSESEIKSLENWFNKKQNSIQKEVKQTNAGFELKQQADRDIIETTLEKMYKDTLGNTYYKLTNGQVWKQVQSGSVSISNGGSQVITIEPKMMGSWLLKGTGNRGVKVKRIR